jgi:hypothetical protein
MHVKWITDIQYSVTVLAKYDFIVFSGKRESAVKGENQRTETWGL